MIYPTFSTHKVVSDRIGQNKKVLDVGCNEGVMARISHKSNKFYGLDISRAAIEKAKKYYIKVSLYDLNSFRSLPWDIKYDVIVFADVLEHTVYPDKVLTAMIKNLKKDGRVIISLPNIANWEVRTKLLFGHFNSTEAGILDRTHPHFYTFKTAENLVRKVGLKITDVDSGSTYLGILIKLAPFLKGLLTTSIVIEAKR